MTIKELIERLSRIKKQDTEIMMNKPGWIDQAYGISELRAMSSWGDDYKTWEDKYVFVLIDDEKKVWLNLQ